MISRRALFKVMAAGGLVKLVTGLPPSTLAKVIGEAETRKAAARFTINLTLTVGDTRQITEWHGVKLETGPADGYGMHDVIAKDHKGRELFRVSVEGEKRDIIAAIQYGDGSRFRPRQPTELKLLTGPDPCPDVAVFREPETRDVWL